MLRLNDHTKVMAKHLTKGFVDLRRHGLAAESLTELRLDHVECRFHVAALVIMAQKLFPIVVVETQHPRGRIRY